MATQWQPRRLGLQTDHLVVEWPRTFPRSDITNQACAQAAIQPGHSDPCSKPALIQARIRTRTGRGPHMHTRAHLCARAHTYTQANRQEVSTKHDRLVQNLRPNGMLSMQRCNIIRERRSGSVARERPKSAGQTHIRFPRETRPIIARVELDTRTYQITPTHTRIHMHQGLLRGRQKSSYGSNNSSRGDKSSRARPAGDGGAPEPTG